MKLKERCRKFLIECGPRGPSEEQLEEFASKLRVDTLDEAANWCSSAADEFRADCDSKGGFALECAMAGIRELKDNAG